MEEQVIKIVGLDKENIRESQVVKGGWVLPFKLSVKPNDSWERYYYEVHRKSTNPKKKEVKLVNGCLEVQFSEADKQQQILDTLIEEVAATNDAYKDIYLKKIQMQEDMKAMQLRQSAMLQKIKDDAEGLQF
jgi:hypothetical protein